MKRDHDRAWLRTEHGGVVPLPDLGHLIERIEMDDQVGGGVRDLEEMIAFDFPVFARHLVPTTGRGRLKVEAIGAPIEVDGVAVAPGDIIVADGTGAVCLPQAVSGEIVTRAEALQRDDEAAVAEIQRGLGFSEAMKKFTRI